MKSDKITEDFSRKMTPGNYSDQFSEMEIGFVVK